MKKIILEKMFDNQVWKIILNDPKANIIDSIMLGEIMSVMKDASNEKHCKLIILQGGGNHFSFGVSVEEHTPDLAAGMLNQFHEFFIELSNISIPVCSMVSGFCLGGGLEFAAFANFVFADETAKMGQPEVVLSVFPTAAAVMLPQKIGQTYADDIILTGRTVGAKEAKSMGLVNEVYADKQAMEEGVNAWIKEHILPKSASALRLVNKVARWRFHQRLRDDLHQFTAIYLNETMKTFDGNEGLNSFLEKRKPVWKDE